MTDLSTDCVVVRLYRHRLKEALHNLSRFAFESSQTVRQGVQAQRLPYWQVKLGNAAAASVRPNRLAAGALRALDRRQCSLP